MRLSNKHDNVNIIAFSDFTGGLNTSAAPDRIADNELSEAINVEWDISTKLLETVDGMETEYYASNGTLANNEILSLFYDGINDQFLFDDGAHIYHTVHNDNWTITGIHQLADLEGLYAPMYTSWENGVIFATGGHLQYYDGNDVHVLNGNESISDAQGVFTRNGRVVTWHNDTMYYSTVGDESDWEMSAEFLQVGYKDAGKIVAVIPYAQDILVLKDNHYAFRILGNPGDDSWQVVEVSRNITCDNRLAAIPLENDCIFKGKNALYKLTSGVYYGDLSVATISDKVIDLIEKIPPYARLIHIKSLRQLWFVLDDERVLCYHYHLPNGAFTTRKFFGKVHDVAERDGEVYVAIGQRICKLNKSIFKDDERMFAFKFRTKRHIANRKYLVKEIETIVTPEYNTPIDGSLKIGPLTISHPIRNIEVPIYQNYQQIYHNRHLLYDYLGGGLIVTIFNTASEVFEDYDEVFKNNTPIYGTVTAQTNSQNIFNTKYIDVVGWGQGGKLMFNKISIYETEVG